MQQTIILLVSSNEEKIKSLETAIQSKVANTKIYSANDRNSALVKIQNDPPHVVFTELDLPKFSGTKLIKTILENPALSRISIVIMDQISKDEIFLDELVKGRVIFLLNTTDEQELLHSLNKAIRFSEHEENEVEFYTRIMATGEILMQQGDPAECVYILKSGRLIVYHSVDEKRVILGYVEPGEFVGELAYINAECRSATVESLMPSQLIEIPIGTFDAVLYKRPAWAKSMVSILSRRLKQSNSART